MLCRGLQVCFMPLDGQEVRACPAGHALNPQESACVSPHQAYLQILGILTDSRHIYWGLQILL